MTIVPPTAGDDALHLVTVTESAFTTLHDAIPQMDDEQLVATYQRATELGNRAWLIQAHCLWEARNRKKHHNDSVLTDLARNFGVSREWARQLTGAYTALASRQLDANEPPLPRSYYVEAGLSHDPERFAAVAEDKKAEHPGFSVRDLRAEIAADARAARIAERTSAPLAVAPPVRIRYGVLLVDPPWRYDNTGTNGAAAKHYGTLAMDDLATLPLADIAAPDAVLILWATWPLLGEALALIERWGFSYKAGLPWIKTEGERADVPNFGMGWWVRGCSEPILIAVRGKAAPPEADWVGLISPAFNHSKKPDSIYDYAESLPGPYCEIFARQVRDGWTAVGDEIDGRDVRAALREMVG